MVRRSVAVESGMIELEIEDHHVTECVGQSPPPTAESDTHTSDLVSTSKQADQGDEVWSDIGVRLERYCRLDEFDKPDSWDVMKDRVLANWVYFGPIYCGWYPIIGIARILTSASLTFWWVVFAIVVSIGTKGHVRKEVWTFRITKSLVFDLGPPQQKLLLVPVCVTLIVFGNLLWSAFLIASLATAWNLMHSIVHKPASVCFGTIAKQGVLSEKTNASGFEPHDPRGPY